MATNTFLLGLPSADILIDVRFGSRPNEQDIPHLTSRKGKNSFYVSATDIPGVNHLVRLPFDDPFFFHR